MRVALITGIAGQDGSYLAEYLLELGYEVHGTIRSDDRLSRNLRGLRENTRVHYHYADLRDESSLEKVIRKVNPDEIYNLAGQVFVPISWTLPGETFDVNTGGLVRILKIANTVCPAARIYQASTSEMYGNVLTSNASIKILALNEASPMHPVSPYGASKLAAHKLIDVYRQKGMYAVSGILFNHESPRRGLEMVTRKITRQIARWTMGDKTELRLGNIQSRRDWGFAGDYVKAMHQMLQQSHPADYVIGTGEAHSVEEFIQLAIRTAGLPDSTRELIKTNCPEFSRPSELMCLIADCFNARAVLDWRPETSFEELVAMMVEADIHELTTICSISRCSLPGTAPERQRGL